MIHTEAKGGTGWRFVRVAISCCILVIVLGLAAGITVFYISMTEDPQNATTVTSMEDNQEMLLERGPTVPSKIENKCWKCN